MKDTGKLPPFGRLDAQDAQHLSSVGSPLSQSQPKMKGRAGDLFRALTRLSDIKPVLQSNYLVKGWLDRGASSVVYGDSNVGKTFFALDLAMHVAAGKDWRGYMVPSSEDWAGGVVFIACEGGSGINNRVEAIRREYPDLVRGAEMGGGFTLLPTTIDIHGANDTAALLQALEGINPIGLIVIDTLARAMGSGDENTAKDMGTFIGNVDALRSATGAHVMVIHHNGKDTTRGARGSGSLRAAVDTEIEITRLGDVIMAETRKQRDMQSNRVFACTLRSVEIGTDEDDEPVTSAVVVETEPVKKTPEISPRQQIAMQAFGDALAVHGVTKSGEMFPTNRQCVSLADWRSYCDRHSLTDGTSNSAARQAFGRAWKSLQEKGLIRVIDGFAWRCGE